MSLKLIERFGISLRLSLWYAGIFTLSAALLFWLFFYLLKVSLDRKDREVVDARAKQFATIYQAGGPGALRRSLQNSADEQDRSTLVRVLSPLGGVVFITVPKDWVEFDEKRIDAFGRQSGWVRIPRDAERDLVLAAIALGDGSIMQVGRMSNSRTLMLEPFKRLALSVVLPMAMAGFAGGLFLAYRTMKPVRQIAETASSIINTGKMDERIPVPESRDELRELAIILNSLLEKNQGLIRGMRDSLDNVSHDLRTPLTRLRGIAEMALTQKASPEQMREALADCMEESEKVLTMLSTLLDVAEAEAGVMRLRLEKTDVSKLIAETVELYEYVAEEKKIAISSKMEPDELLIDQTRMRQVFGNLLDNAIKYTPPGGKVEITGESRDGRYMVSFADNGIGIPPEEQPRIWERLYRGDKSRSQRGLGLGLSFVKAIVEAHGGEVEVRSEQGKGAVFLVTLSVHGCVTR